MGALMRRIILIGIVLMPLTLPGAGQATGHGPVFGLATPTLGRGGWSLDIAVMDRMAGGRHTAMLRSMISYGITEDLQVSASLPMPLYTRQGLPQSRVMAMMPANPDVELLLGWRFHRQGRRVGARFESTVYLGFDYPTDPVRNGIRTWPGLYTAGVTGYASRSVYVWVSGQYRRYMSPAVDPVDRLGDTAMYSLVLGYRPAYFRKEYPHPDWRLFIEAVGEVTGKDRLGGRKRPDSGGHQLFIGPTLLGLYGAWGVSFGPLFPVYRNLNGTQLEDSVRVVVNYTYWF
jgi:hypothetical protein